MALNMTETLDEIKQRILEQTRDDEQDDETTDHEVLVADGDGIRVRE